jgi:hypothetical protein
MPPKGLAKANNLTTAKALAIFRKIHHVTTKEHAKNK